MEQCKICETELTADEAASHSLYCSLHYEGGESVIVRPTRLLSDEYDDSEFELDYEEDIKELKFDE